MERKKLEAQQGNPVHYGVGAATRLRILREVVTRSWYRNSSGQSVSFMSALVADCNRVFDEAPSRRSAFDVHSLEREMDAADIDEFLQFLELCAARIVRHKTDARADLEVVQSLLADDLSAWRMVNVGSERAPRIQVQVIDVPHLHTVLTDRTFELTRIAELASAQNDYADAWKHYSAGNLDNALTDAHKAVESACKAIVKKVDPNSTPDNMQFGPLVGLLVQHDVIPQQLNHVCGQLEQIFRGAGSLRNQPGAAHGSLNPTSPEASVALLGLRLSGTLIAFLAERWLQIK